MAGKGETGILTLYSDVQATSVRWLWYPFIAVGKITLLQGDPGDGKSTMMMNLIAELSKGGWKTNRDAEESHLPVFGGRCVRYHQAQTGKVRCGLQECGIYK